MRNVDPVRERKANNRTYLHCGEKERHSTRGDSRIGSGTEGRVLQYKPITDTQTARGGVGEDRTIRQVCV